MLQLCFWLQTLWLQSRKSSDHHLRDHHRNSMSSRGHSRSGWYLHYRHCPSLFLDTSRHAPCSLWPSNPWYQNEIKYRQDAHCMVVHTLRRCASSKRQQILKHVEADSRPEHNLSSYDARMRPGTSSLDDGQSWRALFFRQLERTTFAL